jgi:hypothetical protein
MHGFSNGTWMLISMIVGGSSGCACPMAACALDTATGRLQSNANNPEMTATERMRPFFSTLVLLCLILRLLLIIL